MEKEVFTSFAQIEEYVLSSGFKKKLVLAASEDDIALKAVTLAKERGIVEPILVGDSKKTADILRELGKDPADFEMIDEPDPAKAARKALTMVKEGTADVPMKGLMQSSTYLRTVLDKEFEIFPKGNHLASAEVFEHDGRLVIATDVAITIAPEYKEKIKIIENAVGLAKQFGVEVPKVAVITPVETVNPAIPSTVEASMLAMANRRGQIKGCIVDGPLALDNALSRESCIHKGIDTEVGGFADALIFPDLDAGNTMLKAVICLAPVPAASVTLGTTKPIVFTSRSDKPESKYNAILMAAFRSLKMGE